MKTDITPQIIEDGFKQLEELAVSEYGRTLPEVVESLKEEHGADRLYFGRLLGIMVKEPFSEVRLTAELRGTKRQWELLPERLKDPTTHDTWQFQVIEQLQKESVAYGIESYSTVEAMAEEVKRETGFFWHLLRSVRKYVCGDPKFSAEFKRAMNDVRQTGSAATLPSASIAATLGTLLATHVPWLGIASAPLITGVVLLLWKIGYDAFCSWSGEIIDSQVWYRDS